MRRENRLVYRKAGETMLFRRLVVWNSTILVFLTAVFVWYNLTSTQKNCGGRSLQFLLYLNGHRCGRADIGFPGCAQSDVGALRHHLCAESLAVGRCHLAGRGTENPNGKTIQRKSDEIFPDLPCGNLWFG